MIMIKTIIMGSIFISIIIDLRYDIFTNSTGLAKKI